MAISSRRRYRFIPPSTKAVDSILDFSQGLNTRDPDVEIAVRVANNVRFGLSSGFKKRDGTQIKGSAISTSTKVLGLHSYVKKGNTAYLLATAGTDIYRYTDSNTPATIATSTNAQATGYSKDRKVFFTTALDANSKPYLVILYQSGAGIKLEWSDSTGATAYATWSNTVISVDGSTQIAFAAYMDSSDNIHVAFNSDANTVKYVKMTYAAGPTWSAGTSVTISGSGASDSAFAPTIFRLTTGEIHVAYRYYNGTNYDLYAQISTDGGLTWAAFQSLGVSSTNARKFASLVNFNNIPVVLSQVGSASATTYYYHIYSGTYLAGVQATTSALGTDGAYSAVFTGGSLNITNATGTGSAGVSHSAFSTSSTAQRRLFSVVNDGASDNDITYQNVIGGSTDSTATRVTNDSNNNLYPTAPQYFSSAAVFNPVFWVEGTASPYNIKVSSSVRWVALSAGLTTNLPMNSAYFPFTGGGGTDQIYFVNGTNTVKKWDGTTLTSATATGYPTPTWICHFENHLWMGGAASNRAYYTNSGADNFSSPGTFPAGNNVDFPEDTLWGHPYRGAVLLVFGRKGVYKVQNFDYSGANVGPEVLTTIPDSFGTLSGRTVVQIGYWVYYQRPDGHIMRTNGEYAELVSDIISPTIASLNLSQLSLAAAGTVGSYYYLAVTGAGAAQNDTMVVLDTRKAGSARSNGGFSIDTGKTASCFVTHPDANSLPQLFYGESTTTNATVYQAEIGTSDNGSAIDMDIQTGVHYLGSNFYRKTLDDMLVVADASGDYDLTVSYANLSNLASWTDKAVSLDPGGAIWGQFVWGAFIWGGKSTVQQILHLNAEDRGFKFRFRNNAATAPVSVQMISFQHTLLKDIL